MSISIFSITKGGYEQAKAISKGFPHAEVYASSKVGQVPHRLIDGNFKQLVTEAFERDSALVFVMATGIVVRTIAPLLRHKATDPAVVVIDEKGKHVISLLSGHIGGGNALAHEIADYIGGEAVITTSSDVQNKIAVDVLAMKNDLVIDSMKDATRFASDVVNDEPLQLITDGKLRLALDEQWTVVLLDSLEPFQEQVNRLRQPLAHTLLICNRFVQTPVTLRLIPKNIVLGIGCRRGMEEQRILTAIEEALIKVGLDSRSVKKIGTVDVKADEIGLIKAAKTLQLPLEIITRDAIVPVQDQFEGSDFVEKTIGVRAVSEPAAMLASNKEGRFLMKKTSYDGITIAIWEEIYEIR